MVLGDCNWLLFDNCYITSLTTTKIFAGTSAIYIYGDKSVLGLINLIHNLSVQIYNTVIVYIN